MLYVVATPIGNLTDMSLRAIETLKTVDIIAAEDTRVTRKLLTHFDIRTRLVSCHEHNETGRAAWLVEQMLAGQSVALVTDAGTPAISDPGALVVRATHEAGIPVMAVAGPSAFAAALSVSGFESREFTFFGFLPRRKKELTEKLASMAGTVQTAVLYESPHRVVGLMQAVAETIPGIQVSVSCDLTKLYEKTLRGPVEIVLDMLKANENTEKGEYCVVLDLHEIQGQTQAAQTVSLEAQLLDRVLGGQNMRDAIQALVEGGAKKNAVYAAALRLRTMLKEDDVGVS